MTIKANYKLLLEQLAMEGYARVYSSQYDNWRNDPKPRFVVLGRYKHPRTRNTLVGGINLHYLNDNQIEDLRKVIQKILQPRSLKARYWAGRKLAPKVFDTAYRTYNKDYIHAVTPQTLRFYSSVDEREAAKKEKEQEQSKHVVAKKDIKKAQAASAVAPKVSPEVSPEVKPEVKPKVGHGLEEPLEAEPAKEPEEPTVEPKTIEKEEPSISTKPEAEVEPEPREPIEPEREKGVDKEKPSSVQRRSKKEKEALELEPEYEEPSEPTSVQRRKKKEREKRKEKEEEIRQEQESPEEAKIRKKAEKESGITSTPVEPDTGVGPNAQEKKREQQEKKEEKKSSYEGET